MNDTIIMQHLWSELPEDLSTKFININTYNNKLIVRFLSNPHQVSFHLEHDFNGNVNEIICPLNSNCHLCSVGSSPTEFYQILVLDNISNLIKVLECDKVLLLKIRDTFKANKISKEQIPFYTIEIIKVKDDFCIRLINKADQSPKELIDKKSTPIDLNTINKVYTYKELSQIKIVKIRLKKTIDTPFKNMRLKRIQPKM